MTSLMDIPFQLEREGTKWRILQIDPKSACPSTMLSNAAWFYGPEDPKKTMHSHNIGEVVAYFGSDWERPKKLHDVCPSRKPPLPVYHRRGRTSDLPYRISDRQEDQIGAIPERSIRCGGERGSAVQRLLCRRVRGTRKTAFCRGNPYSALRRHRG